MISEYINKVVESNVLLSLVVACICVIIFYAENRRTKKEIDKLSYFKLLAIIIISIFFVLFIKNKKIPLPDSNVKIDEPDF